jgi:hypothetical protein
VFLFVHISLLIISTNNIARGRDGRKPWYVKKPGSTSYVKKFVDPYVRAVDFGGAYRCGTKPKIGSRRPATSL